MRLFIVIATIFLASSPNVFCAISTQFHAQDHLGQYSYGYADPNSQKHESRSHDGVTKGAYSYVDGYGHVQSVSYFADPHTGFHVTGTNLPKAPLPLHHAAPAIYAAPYIHHIPVLTPHGVPADTPEVQHAKAAHFAAHAAAKAGHHHLWKRSLWGYGHVPVIHNGVPVDTPEVQHAKAAHFAAHAAAAVGHPIPAASHHGAYHVPVIHNGVPVDTPEVQHAKAAHFAAVAKASVHAGHYEPAHNDGHYDHHDGHYDHHDGHYDHKPYQGPIHIPVIHNGVPVEPPAVQHAKASHLAALAEAHSRAAHGHGHYDGHHEDDGQYHPEYHHGW